MAGIVGGAFRRVRLVPRGPATVLPMTRVRVATLNLKKNELDWDRREPWLLQQLAALDVDVIAFQEIALRIDQGNGIRARLNTLLGGDDDAPYRIHHVANPRENVALEAIALMTRLPVRAHEGFDYLFRNRVAHRLRVDVGGAEFDVWNTHFHHEVGDEANAVRTRQAEQLAGWITDRTGSTPHALVGDLNATPGTAPLRLLSRGHRSAYEAAHGAPPQTTVSPMHVRSTDLPGNLPLDHILVSDGVAVVEARLAFEHEDPRQPGIWASDHVGLVADLEW
jgi:endonuclease/exonuclease/phosphatase family metal-dependent hydrolase